MTHPEALAEQLRSGLGRWRPHRLSRGDRFRYGGAIEAEAICLHF